MTSWTPPRCSYSLGTSRWFGWKTYFWLNYLLLDTFRGGWGMTGGLAPERIWTWWYTQVRHDVNTHQDSDSKKNRDFPVAESTMAPWPSTACHPTYQLFSVALSHGTSSETPTLPRCSVKVFFFLTRQWDGASCAFYIIFNPGWWFGTFFIFPYIGLLIIPIDVHIFQRGGLTTNQLSYFIYFIFQLLG